jgi:hypothetical protein
MVVLGIAALGMLRELRTSGRVATTWTAEHDGSVDAAKRTVVDWNERADALLAAAYPEPPLVRVLGSPDAEYQQRPVDNWPKAAQAVGRLSPRELDKVEETVQAYLLDSDLPEIARAVQAGFNEGQADPVAVLAELRALVGTPAPPSPKKPR